MSCKGHCCAQGYEALCEVETGFMAINKITAFPSAICPLPWRVRRTCPPPQRVHSHEDDLVEYPLWPIIALQQAHPQLLVFHLFEGRQSR